MRALLLMRKKSSDKPRQHAKKWSVALLTKVRIVKATVFLAVLYRCECWAIKG